MPTPEKIATVKEVGEKLDRSSVVYVSGYAGMDVETLTDLRRRLRGADAEFKVVKNNLIRLALDETPWKDAGQDLNGPTALTFAYGEAAAAAKILRDFAKEHDGKPEMKKIGYETEVFDGEYLKTLASLPTREEALGMLAGALNAIPASFARVLNALKEKMEEQGAETAAAVAEGGSPAEEKADAPAADAAGESAEEGGSEEKPAE